MCGCLRGNVEDQDEVTCHNCGIPAKEYFEIIGDKMPESINPWNFWYCSEECYDEDTQYEG